jgi:hypothetical protein
MKRKRNAGAVFPDFAEFIIGRRFAPTRWLHPGDKSAFFDDHATSARPCVPA